MRKEKGKPRTRIGIGEIVAPPACSAAIQPFARAAICRAVSHHQPE
jgi:hypothetical protein